MHPYPMTLRHLAASVALTLLALPACLSLVGCGHGGGISGIGMRANGNQLFTLHQVYTGAGSEAEPSAAAANGNLDVRQGGSGGIVNNFYLGANSAEQSAAKSLDGLKTAANVAATGSGDSAAAGNPAVTAPPSPAASVETPPADPAQPPPATPVE